MANGQQTILQALDSQRSSWIALAGVVGMGIGHGPRGPEIRVYIDCETTAESVDLPDSLHGFPVVRVVSGAFTAHDGQPGDDQPNA